MNVDAATFFAGSGEVNPSALEATFTDRITEIRRLRQRLIEPPPGLGRPYWLDDDHFDVSAHVPQVRCPAPGNRDAALAIAVDAITRPLPRSRPLWQAVIITDLTNDHGHIVLAMVLHHALADGVGGLAILGHLVDGISRTAPTRKAASPLRGRGRRNFSPTAWSDVCVCCADFPSPWGVCPRLGPSSDRAAADVHPGVL